MSYQVLALKWRPQKFSDVVGQEHILVALVNSLKLRKVHHAYLFSGTRGVGKTTIARLFSKGLNCNSGITTSPCDICSSCLEIKQGRFIDLIEIDAASRTKVEDTRELLDDVQYAPIRGRFKIYLIDEVHMLSRHSFNALLKTLEEPPEHVKFLLATTDAKKLPITILSRCLHFPLKVLRTDQIRNRLEYVLQQENVDAEPEALQLLARAAGGSMRDALSLTDQALAIGQGKIFKASTSSMLGILNPDQPLSLIESLYNLDGNRAMFLLQEFADSGIEWEILLIEMLNLLHQIAIIQIVPSSKNEDGGYREVEKRLQKLAHKISPTDLQIYYQIILIGRKELSLAPDYRTGVEMTLIRVLLAFHQKIKISELITEPMIPEINDQV